MAPFDFFLILAIFITHRIQLMINSYFKTYIVVVSTEKISFPPELDIAKEMLIPKQTR